MSETPIGAWRRRTLLQSTLASVAASAFTLPSIAAEGPVQGGTLTFVAVSYTHLTLPTIYSV